MYYTMQYTTETAANVLSMYNIKLHIVLGKVLPMN
jgi:hypothetical protein